MHHVFAYKFRDDCENTIKNIYTNFDSKGETLKSVDIGLNEKLIGFRVQKSDWIDCKISKICFKIAKCEQKGIDFSKIEDKVNIINMEKLKLQKEAEEFAQS
jgi:hypothetical protein